MEAGTKYTLCSNWNNLLKILLMAHNDVNLVTTIHIDALENYTRNDEIK
jgi:hypothetical protein